MDLGDWCDHKPVWMGRVAVAACARCGAVDWLSASGSMDPAEAMAALFGNFDLIGPLEAVGAPAPFVLAYAAPSARKKKNLECLPPRVWLKAGPQLWMCTDGETLLLSTPRRLLFENLTRGA